MSIQKINVGGEDVEIEDASARTSIANINSTMLSSNANTLNIARVLGVAKDCDIRYQNNATGMMINNASNDKIIAHFTYLFNDNCDIEIRVANSTKLTVLGGEQLGDLEFEIPSKQNLTIVKGSTATSEDTVNIRCKYYTYSYS